MTGEVSMNGVGHEREGVATLLTAGFDYRQHRLHEGVETTPNAGPQFHQGQGALGPDGVGVARSAVRGPGCRSRP